MRSGVFAVSALPILLPTFRPIHHRTDTNLTDARGRPRACAVKVPPKHRGVTLSGMVRHDDPRWIRQLPKGTGALNRPGRCEPLNTKPNLMVGFPANLQPRD